MGGMIGTPINDGSGEGQHDAAKNESQNKRQDIPSESATAESSLVAAEASQEPPAKRQRIGEPSMNNDNTKSSNEQNQKKQQQQKWQQRDGKKTSKKKQKNKHMDPNILRVRKAIQDGCRTNDLASAMKIYQDALKTGIRIEAQSYYNLLNLCDGLDRDERKVHVGTPKHDRPCQQPQSSTDSKPTDENCDQIVAIDSKQRQEYVFSIKERMQSKEVNLPLNETAYSAIVKLLSKNKEFQKAEEILTEAEGVQQCKPKLRLYASLMHAYCQDQRLAEALSCWKRLRWRASKLTRSETNQGPPAPFDGMDVTEREYLELLRCAVGSFRARGGSCGDGSDLVVEDVLTRLAEDVPVPAKDTVAAIMEWFELQGSSHNSNSSNKNDSSKEDGDAKAEPAAPRSVVQELLNEIRTYDSVSEPSPRMGPVTDNDIGASWAISRACSIDSTSGRLLDGCLEGHALKPVPLSDRSFTEMVTMNESILTIGNIKGNAHCKFQGGRKGKKRTDFSPEHRKMEWERFNAFLERGVNAKPPGETSSSTMEPYQVVIDGANIGYYKQNYVMAPKHVDYEQIDLVVRHFINNLNKKVLLVMHTRHFQRYMLPQQYRGLVDAWIKEGILYQTPAGMNDDWFWMHAALKYKTLVVTNDEMRDHHFQMLAPKFFLRWKDRQQVRFDFVGSPSWETDPNRPRKQPNATRRVILTYPDVYSRRIQRVADGLVVPLAKRGDENRFLDGCHVASDREPEQELYLCVRPNNNNSSSAKEIASNGNT